MKYLVDSATMKKIDIQSQEQFGMPAAILMERAALAVAKVVAVMAEKKSRILAVCGTGNNGGDGIAAARILHEWGYSVDIWILGDEKRGSELMKKQLMLAENCGVERFRTSSTSGIYQKLRAYTILIDAIFGIGLTRTVEGSYADCINEMNLSGVPIVAVDMPSGVQADDGQILSIAVQATKTVTFGYDKMGLELYPGKSYAGEVVLEDIGFPKRLEEKVEFPAFSYERSDLSLRPARWENGNKGTFGKVLVVGGSKNMCGACYLSAKAAFRTGAGMVKIMTVEENRSALHTLLPEAILSTYDSENVKNKLEIDRLCREMSWADAIVVGPGLGRSPGAGQIVEIVLKNATVPIVVDADALHHIAANPEYIRQHAEGEKWNHLLLPENLILTPHLKEMSDLLSCTVEDISQNLVETAKSVVHSMPNSSQKKIAGNRPDVMPTVRGFTLVLKDARTVVAKAGKKQVCINHSGNSGMATAGSGDVLTGVIAALLAQEMPSFEAASFGVFLHGLAGDEAAKKVGRDACMAGDIIEGLTEFRR